MLRFCSCSGGSLDPRLWPQRRRCAGPLGFAAQPFSLSSVAKERSSWVSQSRLATMNSRVPYPFCAFCRKGGLFRSKSTDSLLFHSFTLSLFHSFTLSLLSVLPTSPPHTHIPTKKHCHPDRSGPVPFPRAFLRAPGHAAEGSLFDPRALSPPKKSCHPERSEGSALSFLATRHSPLAASHSPLSSPPNLSCVYLLRDILTPVDCHPRVALGGFPCQKKSLSLFSSSLHFS